MKGMLRKSALTLLSVLFVSNGFSMGQQGSDKPATPQETTKPASITLMVDGTFLVKENGEAVLEKGYEDLTGIDLKINHPAHNEYHQKVDLAFATGDAPDLMILGAKDYVNYVANGALYDLTDLYENSKMKKNISQQGIIDSLRVDGRLYGIPYQRGNGTVTYVRGDWLEKLNMKAPTNYNEFINMLRAFKNNNPDGLPPEKVIPITAAGLVNSEYPMDIYLREFYQDATPDYVEVNGKWVDGMLEPNMPAALKRLRDAYAEGLIDTEIITNKTSTCRDKFYTGTVGAFNYWAGIWNATLQQNLDANIPSAKVTPIPPIKETKYIERAATVLSMKANVANPQGVFDYFLEFMLDGGPGQTLFTFGVEGKTYKVVDGVIEFLPSIQDPGKNFTKAWFDPTIPVTNFAPASKREPLIDSSLHLFWDNMINYGIQPPSEQLVKLTPEVNAIRASIISKVVFGELTVDQGMAQYKKDIAKYNEVIIPDMNK